MSVLAFALAAVAVSPAKAPPTAFYVYPVVMSGDERSGPGASCADVQTQFDNVAINYWVTAFWSGINYSEKRSVGSTTNSRGILAEIKFYCQEHPSVSLTDATILTYRRLQAEGK